LTLTLPLVGLAMTDSDQRGLKKTASGRQLPYDSGGESRVHLDELEVTIAK
jgi:hypothetical protein